MAIKRRTRMYEPWGYQEENNYQGAETILENDLSSFFASVSYNRDDNKIHFANKDGEEVATLNVNDFIKSDSIIEKTEYKNGILTITFTNGDVVRIDLTELLDENEFADGLIVDNHVVKVLVDATSEKWLTVSSNGVKVSGIQAEIDRLDEKIEAEESRAISAETELNEKIESIESGSTEKLDELIERLGYKDNDTLNLTNEHEVAFGEYNISNTDIDPSGQTIFSIGIGANDEDRKNALEVRKDGSVYMWIEDDYIKINDLIGMLAHEIY